MSVKPDWVETDFVRGLNLSGTGLKAYGASIHGIKTWMLKGKRKIYKDNYGHITMEWVVHPEIKGNEWSVKSDLGFAPATNGSFANDKFVEFKETVRIAGREAKGMFGWQNFILEARPRDGHGEKFINELVADHLKSVKVAKKFWKVALGEAKKQFGLTGSDDMKIKEKKVAGLNPEKLPNLSKRSIGLFDKHFKKILFEMRLTAGSVETGDFDTIDFLHSLANECDSAASSLKIAAKGYRMIAKRVEGENR